MEARLEVGAAGFNPGEKTLSRFNSKIKLDGLGCWRWQDALTKKGLGYGRFYWNRRTHAAHRFAYEVAKGPIPEGLQIDHLCKQRSCVNPEHLQAVTGTINLRRSDAWSGKNFRKTHCPRGHPYDEGNTYITPTGGRQCRQCVREASRKWKTGSRDLQPSPETCANGHPWTPENRGLQRKGSNKTHCIPCRRESARLRMQRKRQERAAQVDGRRV